MSLTYGFYNSSNGDRKYDALQLSSIFDGIITDGIFATVGEQFMVSAGSIGMSVLVNSGRGWFKHTWTLNDSDLTLTISTSESLLNRIDTVVIDVDRVNRVNSIIVVKGTPSSNPVAPTLIDTADHKQYPLADVYVGAGVTKITQSNITNRIGVYGGTPFVEGVLPDLDVEKLIAQWENQWNDWLENKYNDFDEWFEQLQVMLDGDVTANLSNRIIAIEDQLDAPEMHRNIFRGKNLGSKITAEQQAAIAAGTFDDLYIGDYWELDVTIDGNTIEKVKWRIVDIDYWLGTGNAECTYHHVVVMPDNPICNRSMHSSASTAQGYANSSLRQSIYATGPGDLGRQLVDLINNDLGALVVDHDEFLTTLASNGVPTDGAWRTSVFEIPSEIMMYGHNVFGVTNDGVSDPHLFTNSLTQLALFRLCPKFIVNSRTRYWLRDIVSATQFAIVLEAGNANRAKASSSYGVRPVVAIA